MYNAGIGPHEVLLRRCGFDLIKQRKTQILSRSVTIQYLHNNKNIVLEHKIDARFGIETSSEYFKGNMMLCVVHYFGLTIALLLQLNCHGKSLTIISQRGRAGPGLKPRKPPL